MFAVPGPHQASPGRESSIGELGVQELNFSQGPDELYTAFEREGIDPLRTGSSDAQPSTFFSHNYSYPFCDQAGHSGAPFPPNWEPSATSPLVLSPGQNPEAGVQTTHSPGMSDEYLGDGFGAFAEATDDQIRENDKHTTDQNILPEVNSPFNRWSLNDIPLREPVLSYPSSYGQSSHVSPPQLEYMSDTHPESPFEHHPGQEVEAPAVGEFQLVPQTETTPMPQSSENEDEDMRSRTWPCHHPGCNKRYKRPQEVKRHTRAKHEISPTCFACGKKWTRAADIRKHLINRHGNRFTEEQRQNICRSRGLNDTIELLVSLESQEIM